MTAGERADAAGTIPQVESVLESVVVHASGAVCRRRTACTPLPTADGAARRIRLVGLPIALYEDSLRARVVSGPPGLRVTDVRLDVDVALKATDELPRLRLDMEDAEDRQDSLRDRRDRLLAEIEEVAGLRAVPPQPRPGDPPRWAPVESMLALATFVDNRLAQLHGRLRVVEDELRRVDHDVQVFRRQRDEASGALVTERARTFAAAVLTLDQVSTGGSGRAAGPSTTQAEIELEYHVPGASWAPVYQLRLDRSPRSEGSDPGGALVLRACVAQRTGEDWTGVRLGLSTADLQRRTDLPELRSLRIGRRQDDPAPQGWREPPAGLDELFAGYDAAASARTGGPASGTDEARMDREATRGAVGGLAARPAAQSAPHAYGEAPGASPPPPAPGAAPALAARQRSVPRPEPEDETPAPGALAPAEPLLDYHRLTLAGPQESVARGKLQPGASAPNAVVAEYRRRAESVERLKLPAHAVRVRRSAGSFDYRFDTAAPVEVEADGAWHTVPVCEIPVELSPEYVCVPAVEEAVFGTVLLANTSGHALLSGPADVTVDGDFLMTVPLPTLAPGERQRVGIGVVESVQVARRAHMEESAAGIRGGTTVLDHSIEVELANRLPHTVVVQVRERIPVSVDRDVRIDEHQAVPAWSVDEELHDDRYVRGARVWRIKLEPGQVAALTGGYEIRIPAGKALVGGNRRD